MDSDKIAQATPPKEDSTAKAESEMKKVNPSSSSGQSPASTNGQLVYVRRRVELLDSAKPTTNNKPIPVTSSLAPESPKLDWEERYQHLQMHLNKLNDSSHHTDHLQMLWSLSSAELSKHAVDLEKRSIQFSLEEAREMQRVAALNVLGRSLNSLKSTSNDGE